MNGATTAVPLDAADLRRVVARAQQHDPDAWEVLYRHCRPRLLDYARRRLPDLQAAEDAVSDALVRSMERIEQFSWRGAGFDAWMYGILRNVVLESYRSSGRSARLVERSASDVVVAAMSGHGEAPPGTRIEQADEIVAVRDAFSSLPDDDREILELRVVGQLSAEQVGEVIGKRAGAVRMSQSRPRPTRAALLERDHG
ncbi:MAG: sigma-70 family RNA polymerase sigma factor [Ilumatobacteraceae bacterium]